MSRRAPGSGGGIAPPMYRPYIAWWNEPSGSSVISTVLPAGTVCDPEALAPPPPAVVRSEAPVLPVLSRKLIPGAIEQAASEHIARTLTTCRTDTRAAPVDDYEVRGRSTLLSQVRKLLHILARPAR